jgi:hypothetical protein
VETQAPAQVTCPGGQVKVQLPLTQACPVPQAMPHPPQFARSLVMSRQFAPQVVSPLGHTSVQRPRSHA